MVTPVCVCVCVCGSDGGVEGGERGVHMNAYLLCVFVCAVKPCSQASPIFVLRFAFSIIHRSEEGMHLKDTSVHCV